MALLASEMLWEAWLNHSERKSILWVLMSSVWRSLTKRFKKHWQIIYMLV